MASGALQEAAQGGARHGAQGRGAGACGDWVYMRTRSGRVRGGCGTDTRESGAADSGCVQHGHEPDRARLGRCWAKSNPVPRKRVQGARANFKIWAEQLTWVGAETSCGRSWRSKGGLPRMGLAQMKRKGFFHFPNLIFNTKTFPGNPSKCFKARTILRKFKKSEENSQR
jgi:hypothetical protein